MMTASYDCNDDNNNNKHSNNNNNDKQQQQQTQQQRQTTTTTTINTATTTTMTNNNNNKHNNNNNDNKQQQQQQEKGKTELTNRTSRQTVQIYLKSLGNRAQHDREYRSVESEQSNQHSLSCLHTKHKNTLSRTEAQTERHSQTTGHFIFWITLEHYTPSS